MPVEPEIELFDFYGFSDTLLFPSLRRTFDDQGEPYGYRAAVWGGQFNWEGRSVPSKEQARAELRGYLSQVLGRPTALRDCTGAPCG